MKGLSDNYNDLIQQKIIMLEQLNLKTVRFSKIKEIVNSLLDNIHFQVLFCPVSPIYRVRINEKGQSFDNISQLINPKPYKIKHYGRLNKKRDKYNSAHNTRSSVIAG